MAVCSCVCSCVCNCVCSCVCSSVWLYVAVYVAMYVAVYVAMYVAVGHYILLWLIVIDLKLSLDPLEGIWISLCPNYAAVLHSDVWGGGISGSPDCDVLYGREPPTALLGQVHQVLLNTSTDRQTSRLIMMVHMHSQTPMYIFTHDYIHMCTHIILY